MRKCSIFFLVTVLFAFGICSSTLAQDSPKPEKKHGTFYFAWGYNKEWYTKSDIHFVDHTTDNYDFTVHDVSAHDSPRLSHIFDTDISVPQFNYRFGYFFNDRHDLGIEVSFDHAKYIMDENQRTHITGYIREQSLNKDTTTGGHFLYFEHTNGANFLMINLLKRKNLFTDKTGKQKFAAVFKAGGGVVIPKTEVYLMGTDQDNVFHIAGYITGIETAVRWHFLKSFFLEPAVKGVYANYSNVLAVGSARANHHFFAAEIILTGGFQVEIGKDK